MIDFSKDRISPIGLQYFNRPGRQCAFVKRMREGENFNNTRNLERIFFRHDNNVSRLIFNLCQMGKQFYVDDSLAKVVEEIKMKNRFCSQTVNLVGRIFYPKTPIEQISHAATLAEFELTNDLNASFELRQMEREAEDWSHCGGRERYLNSIIVIPIRSVPLESQ